MAKKRQQKKVSENPSPEPVSVEEPLGESVSAEPRHADPNTSPDVPWLIASGGVTAVAAFLRFVLLELKPFHHDEGVNGFFLKSLFNEGVYKYDPANYHGPTLYYISLFFAQVLGFNTVAVRTSVAIFGVLTVVLVLYLRRYIGTGGSLLAALLLALSPGMVFISRYFIHEIFFVFLSLGVVLSVALFIEKREAGPGAIAWMALILLTCFLPTTLGAAAYLGGQNTAAVWAFRIAFFVIESALVYYVIRMILAWDEGRPVYLLLASACVALLFATKETAFITLGTMLIACVCVWIWRSLHAGEAFEKNWTKIVLAFHALVLLAALIYRESVADAGKWLYNTFVNHAFRPPEYFVFVAIIVLLAVSIGAWIVLLIGSRGTDGSEISVPAALTWENFRAGIGAGRPMLIVLGAVAAVFIFLSVLFFTSFFTYGEGVSKAFEAYAIWTKTGNKDHTQNGMLAYLKWGMKIESAILILSLLGSLVALVKGRHRLALFTALWAFGLFAAYTIIPYKTPWLALSFLLPMCIIAGYGLGQLLTSKDLRLKVAGGVLAVVGTGLLSYQTYQQNFVRYDDDDMPYVYAHTRREFLDMVRQIEATAAKSGKGTEATVEIISPDYWPLTWYLNDYKSANFHGRLVDANTAEILVAKKGEQDAPAIQKYSTHYKFEGVYPLRPGVDLMLLVRKDLADADDQELYKILEYKPK